MIKNFKLFEALDFKKDVNYYTPSLTTFFNKTCNANLNEFLISINKFIGREIIITRSPEREEKIRFDSCYVKTTLNENNSLDYSLIIKSPNGVEHTIPADKRIDFNIPKKIITKEDPYGEEDWDS